jgi:hypothetical protein
MKRVMKMMTLLAGDGEGDDDNLPEVHPRIPYSRHLSLHHAHCLQNLHASVSNKLTNYLYMKHSHYWKHATCSACFEQPDDGPTFECPVYTLTHTILLIYILIFLSKLCLIFQGGGGGGWSSFQVFHQNCVHSSQPSPGPLIVHSGHSNNFSFYIHCSVHRDSILIRSNEM